MQRCAVPEGHPELSSTWGTSNTLGLNQQLPTHPKPATLPAPNITSSEAPRSQNSPHSLEGVEKLAQC